MGGAAVLVVEVVGVLPDVEGKDGFEGFGDGVAGAGLLSDDEGAVSGGGKPDPAGAEEAGALGDEVVLEGVEGAPLLLDLRDEFGIVRFVWSSVIGRFELREIEVVVQDLAGVVEDGAGRSLFDDLLKREVLVGRAGEELVEVVHIGLQMLAVVESDGAGADDGLECVGSVGKVDELEHEVGVCVKLRLCSPIWVARQKGMRWNLPP